MPADGEGTVLPLWPTTMRPPWGTLCRPAPLQQGGQPTYQQWIACTQTWLRLRPSYMKCRLCWILLPACFLHVLLHALLLVQVVSCDCAFMAASCRRVSCYRSLPWVLLLCGCVLSLRRTGRSLSHRSLTLGAVQASLCSREDKECKQLGRSFV